MRSRGGSWGDRAVVPLLLLLVTVSVALGTAWPASAAPAGPALAAAIAVLAAATVVPWLPAVAVVPAAVGAERASWPGHPARRAGGDVPRQVHPDAPGRSRPRAPGLG